MNQEEKKLKELFTSRVRLKILQLFINRREVFYVRQICREIEEEINAVRRELQRLARIGFLQGKTKGNRLYYRLNKKFIFYPELVRLVAKSSGLGQKIIEQIEALGQISYVMLALPFVEGRISTERDVDLLVVGRVRLRLLAQLVQEAEEEYGREINYSVMTVEEFTFRKKRGDSFIRRVLAQPQIMLWGNEKKFNEF